MDAKMHSLSVLRMGEWAQSKLFWNAIPHRRSKAKMMMILCA